MRKILLILLFIPICSFVFSQETHLVESQCGKSIMIGDIIFATEVEEASLYEFHLRNSSFSDTILSPVNFLRYDDYRNVPLLRWTNVRVRAMVNDVWSDFSDTCSIMLVTDCGFDYKMNAFLSDDKNRRLIERQSEALPSNLRNMNLEDSSEIVIPVIFHVIVPQTYNNPYDYLPPIKINEALNILNDVFSGTTSDESTAIDTKIRFCPVESYEYQGNTYSLRIGDYCGITYNSINEKINLPENFPYSNSYRDSRDMNGFYYDCFDSNKYLNVFIYSSLHHVGVLGAAWSNRWGFGYVNVCASAIGTNDTYSRRLGYTLPHEVGHYLGLYHTWGYDSTHNDGIDDTPQHLSSNVFCDEFSDSYPDDELYDPIHNIMNYTDDGCRNHFTMGQALMMRYVVRIYYPELPVNFCSHNSWVDYFTPQILAPLETVSCTGIREITIDVGSAPYFELKIYRGEEILDTYASEDFTEQNGRYVLQYDFTDTSEYILQLDCGLDSTRTFSTRHILQTMECSGINTERNDIAQWHFDKGVSLEFRSGIAQRVDTRINATDAETSVCDSDGNLVFYTNGHVLWNSNHEISNEIQLEGCSPKSITAFHLNDNIYMLVYIDESTRSLNCKKIAVSGSNFSLLGSSSIGNISYSGLAVVPSLDAGSYWIITSKRSTNRAFVYKLTAETIDIEQQSDCENAFDIDPRNPNITIKVSPDSKLIVFECPYQGVSLTRFNAHTGTLVKLNECNIDGGKSVNVAFSSNSKYMYVNEQTIGNGNNIEICQYDLSKINSCNCNLQKNVVYSINPYENEEYMRSSLFLQEGPDERIYFSKINDGFSRSQLMGVIMNPNTLGTPSVNDNECETNPEFIRYPFLSNIRNDKYLPNFIDGKPMPCDLDFNVCSVDCSNSVTIMNLSHGYDSLFSWFYVDSIGISHNFHSTELILEPEVQSICMYKTGCNDTICKSVEMNAIPNFNIIGDRNICSDDEEHIYSIDLDDSYIRSYEWRVNDLLSRTHQLVLSQSNLIGADSITIVVEVTDMMGCTKSDSITVAVDHIDYTLTTDYMCDNSQLLNIVTISNNSNDSILVSMPTTNSMLGYMGTISEELENGEYTIEISNENCHYEENVNVYGLENIITSVYPYDCKGRMIKFECEDSLSNYLFYYNGNQLTLIGDSIITIGSMQGYDIVENALESNGMLINIQVQRVGFSECSASLPVYIESVGNKFIVDTIYPYYCEANQGGFIVSLQGNIFPSVVQVSDSNNNSELIPVLIDEDEGLAFIELHGLHSGQYSLTDTSDCYKPQNIDIPDYSCAILPSASFRYNCISGKVSADVIMECNCQISEGTFVHIGQNNSVPVLVDEHNNPYIVLDSLEIATEYNCNIEWDNGCQSEFSISTPEDELYMEITPIVDENHCLSVTFNSNYDNIFNVSIPNIYEINNTTLTDTTISVPGTCNAGNLFCHIYVNDSLNSCNFVDSVIIVKGIDISIDTSSFYCNGIGISVNGGTPPYRVTIASGSNTTELIVSEDNVFHYSDMSHNSTLEVSIFDRYNNSETKIINMPQAYYLPVNFSAPTNYSNGVYIASRGLNINSNVTFSDALIYCYSDDANISNSQWTVNVPYELKFENCTVRACPDKMWQGIVVNGNEFAAQSATTHATIDIKQNTIIADAMIAVKSENGGIVKANNSKFINNRYDIHFGKYDYKHTKTVIRGNKFLTLDGGLNNPNYYPQAHIYMNQVDGISIRSNTFRNENMDADISKWGIGVESSLSGFTLSPRYLTITDPVPVEPRDTFDNLYYGVKASGKGTTAPSIKHNVFTNNFRGVYINNADGSRVLFNNFTGIYDRIYPWQVVFTRAINRPIAIHYLDSYSEPYSVYINNSKSSYCEENTITRCEIGAYISNSRSGSLTSRMYRNKFGRQPEAGRSIDMEGATMVLGINSSSNVSTQPGQTGLEVRCNEYTGTGSAIDVKGNMRQNQGSENKPAGNKFHSSFVNGMEFNAPNTRDNYTYYQTVNATNENFHTELERYFGTGIRYAGNYDEKNCKSNYGTTIIYDDHLERIDFQGKEIVRLKSTYDSIVDRGNTSYMLAQASSISLFNMVIPFVALCNDGYLSDTVFSTLLGNSNSPSAFTAAVLIANSPLPQSVRKMVDDSDLPSVYKTLVGYCQTGMNSRDQLQYSIDDGKQEIIELESEMFHEAINNDTITAVKDTVLTYLRGKTDYTYNDAISEYKLQLSKKDYVAVRDALKSIYGMTTGMEQDLRDELTTFCSINNIYVDYLTATSDAEAAKILDGNSAILLSAVNDSSPLYSGLAEILYEKYADGIFLEYTPLPEIAISNKSMIVSKEPDTTLFVPYVTIYPNPTDGMVFVEYNFEYSKENGIEFLLDVLGKSHVDNCNNGALNIYSSDSKILFTRQLFQSSGISVVDLSNYPTGTYIIEIHDCIGNATSVKIVRF